MIDPKLLTTKEGVEQIEMALKKRHHKFDLDDLIQTYKQRNETITKTEEIAKALNAASKSKPTTAEERSALKELSASLSQAKTEVSNANAKLDQHLLHMPNIPTDRVPQGKTSQDNQELVHLRASYPPPQFDFEPKDHVELMTNLGMVDFDRAAKVSGARFAYLIGDGAKLERALINFMMDIHQQFKDIEVSPPYFVKHDAIKGTGQFPKFVEEMYWFEDPESFENDLWAIPTGEVPLTNYYADEVLKAEHLPIRMYAMTPCFRTEAGAAGKDTKGLIRQHQFNKIEMVSFCDPATVKEELENIRIRACLLLGSLGLHYRVVKLCGGDLGFSAEETLDVEVYLPSQKDYREISSVSSFGTFQARRAKIRFKQGEEKPQFVATLNGSALPIGRTIVALVENYQQKDGTIRIPDPLVKYFGKKEITK